MSEALRLGPEYAEDLAALEKAYPRGLQEGLERLRSKLALLDSSQYSFAWGLFEDGAIVAYVVAYPGTSQIKGNGSDTVIYIDDLYVAPGFFHLLYRLLKVLQLDLDEAGLSGLHIEASGRRSFFRLLEEHPQVFRRLGYEMLGKYAYFDESSGEDMLWARYAPFGGDAVDDQVHISQELREEMHLELD